MRAVRGGWAMWEGGGARVLECLRVVVVVCSSCCDHCGILLLLITGLLCCCCRRRLRSLVLRLHGQHRDRELTAAIHQSASAALVARFAGLLASARGAVALLLGASAALGLLGGGLSSRSGGHFVHVLPFLALDGRHLVLLDLGQLRLHLAGNADRVSQSLLHLQHTSARSHTQTTNTQTVSTVWQWRWRWRWRAQCVNGVC